MFTFIKQFNWIQGAIFGTGIITSWILSGNPNDPLFKWAFIMGLLVQPLWLYETFTKKQWGIFALTLWYTFTWCKGIMFHWFH